MDRAVAPVVSTILLVAIAVILAATVSVFVFDFGEAVEETAPVVGQSSGEFSAQSGNDGRIVTISHVAGDDIRVREMEVAVAATCSGRTQRGRLVSLPLENNKIEQSNINGTDIFDNRYETGYSWDLGALKSESFTAGEKIEFRIPDGECRLTRGDTVTVRVIHVPTNAVVIEQELTAQ